MMKKIALSLYVVAIGMMMFSCGNKTKKDLLVKKWKVQEAVFAGNKLGSEQVAISYVFDSDGSFERTEEGLTEEGTWEYDESKNQLTLVYIDEERKIDATIEEISEARVVFSWEEFTMKRAETLISEIK